MRPVILVASFGTTHDETRERTIGGIERALADAFPGFEVRRAFTSRIVVEKLLERGIGVDGIERALDRCVEDGVSELVVQPTHLLAGREFEKVAAVFEARAGRFAHAVLGRPLLDSQEDIEALADALVSRADVFGGAGGDRTGQGTRDTAFVFMGHGTDVPANAVYARLAAELIARGGAHCFLTTVEAKPDFDETVATVRACGFSRAVLRPVMVVAGDHAVNDMADLANPDSLASKLAAAGVAPAAVTEGLGELPEVRALYLAHASCACRSLGLSGFSIEGYSPSSQVSVVRGGYTG